MSRTTQYIGLNGAAEKFLEEHGKLEGRHVICEGMFGEEIYGSVYRLCSGKVAREVEQVSPWSSGPMIFTCLEIDGQKRFEWREDPDLRKRGLEYDADKGLYWI